MPNFLFWNMARKPLADSLARLAERQSSDVLLLAECAPSPRQVLAALNRKEKVWQWAASLADDSPKLLIFTRFASKLVAPRLDAPRWTIRELSLPPLPLLLIVAVHLPSKLNTGADSQAFETIELASDIRAVEANAGFGG